MMIRISILVVVLVAILGILLRRTRRRPSPCPWWLRFLLENPFMNSVAGPSLVVSRLDLGPGMRVLDIGCGPGRLTIPLAQHVGSEGKVVALDMQDRMLGLLHDRLRAHGLTNVETILGGAGLGALTLEGVFDRAMLVTVLGEIRERETALKEIYRALKPGGILSVTEVLLDPDYQPAGRVIRMARQAGFVLDRRFGSALAFTLNLKKPEAGHEP